MSLHFQNEEPSLLVLSNSEFVLVDTELLPELSQFRWHPTGKEGYAARTAGSRYTVELLHRRINKTPAGLKTDHINGHTYDNRRSNLRTATNSQNGQNSRKRLKATASSKFKGVMFRKDRGTWLALIRVSGKTIKLGTHKSEREAALAYDAAARKYFGEFANLNF